MTGLRERILECLAEKNAKPAHLAKGIGASRATVSDWLSGETQEISTRYLFPAATWLGVTPTWLNTGKPPKYPSKTSEVRENYSGVYAHDGEADSNGERLIPLYENRAAAGGGHPIYTDDPNGYIAFQAAWLRRRNLDRQELVAMEAAGDSMMPYIHDGDTVLIVREDGHFRNGQVYVFRVSDELRIKRIFHTTSGTVRIASDNPDKSLYPDEVLSADQAHHLNVIGRVVWRGG